VRKKKTDEREWAVSLDVVKAAHRFRCEKCGFERAYAGEKKAPFCGACFDKLMLAMGLQPMKDLGTVKEEATGFIKWDKPKKRKGAK